MTRPSDLSCVHERDVLDLVAIGQWPSRADETLRAHVATCATCAEVAAVAAAVREWADETDASEPVKVPDASVVWYRAQVRAREEATRRASRPVLVAQLVALVAVVLAAVWIGPELSLSVSMPEMPVMPDLSGWWPTLPSQEQFGWLGWAAVAAVGASILLGSLALLLTADK
jgi:hypothetical protein